MAQKINTTVHDSNGHLLQIGDHVMAITYNRERRSNLSTLREAVIRGFTKYKVLIYWVHAPDVNDHRYPDQIIKFDD